MYGGGGDASIAATEFKCVTPIDVFVDPTITHMGVTGVCSCYLAGEELLPLIRIRTQADMTGF